MKNTWFILLIVFMGLSLLASDDIRLNQLGYYPKTVKRFVVTDSSADKFLVQNLEGKTLYKGKLVDRGYWKLSNENVKTGDFSSFQEPGQYRIFVKVKGKSHEFEIKAHLYGDVLTAALKSYYFQRASIKLEETYAGQWQRPMGHPDNRCFYHPTSGRSVGFKSSPGGWYDAGDYNKYTVNAGVTVCTLLSLYERLPQVINDQSPRIPGSGNDISNLLDELRKVINEKTANWNNAVDELGCFSLASVKNVQSPIGAVLRKKAVSVINRLADNILKEIQTNPYGIPHSKFEWGSNGDMAYDGMILAYAYHHTGKRKYLEAVVETVDYLFGKNAVGYSFVTGFGDKTPRNIHHRPSGADGIIEPIPGFLVGGPNWERQDSIEKNKRYGVKYPFKEAAKSYVDLTTSFASNEVCINWNAPLIFLLGFLETSAN